MSIPRVPFALKDAPRTLTFCDQISPSEQFFSDDGFWGKLDQLSEILNVHLTPHQAISLVLAKKNVPINQKLIELDMNYSTEEDFNSVRKILLKSMAAELEKKEICKSELIQFLKNRINLLHLFNQQQSINLYQLKIEPPFLNHLSFELTKLNGQNLEEGLREIQVLVKETNPQELECAIKLSWKLQNAFKQMIELKKCAKRIIINPETSRATLNVAKLFFRTG
jgi:hypothetical protein